jgi:demethylmenaquinone methyltransferase/2-methoxy-6-polyprenyl-1,4-benzoquinol methylase
VAIVEAALREIPACDDVLELACGTGLWTRHLAKSHKRVLAVDASSEVISINRARVHSEAVEYEMADLFSWTPPAARFDLVFFGFWLSHVPHDRFDGFWRKVRSALRPGGRTFFVDSLLDQTSTARDHAPLDESGIVHRRLNDGREFRIVKVFHDPTDLERGLGRRGWSGWVRSTPQFFVYGSLTAEGPNGGDVSR